MEECHAERTRRPSVRRSLRPPPCSALTARRTAETFTSRGHTFEWFDDAGDPELDAYLDGEDEEDDFGGGEHLSIDDLDDLI